MEGGGSMQDMLLMSKDNCIARIHDDILEIVNEALLPLYLKRTRNIEEWLSMRAIDEHRTNSRLLKRALRLENKDDVHTVLRFNAATITDTYWMKPTDSSLTYDEVRFKENLFDMLALKGDINSFNQKPSRTPESETSPRYAPFCPSSSKPRPMAQPGQAYAVPPAVKRPLAWWICPRAR